MRATSSVGSMRQRQRRPLLGLLALSVAGFWATTALTEGRAFGLSPGRGGKLRVQRAQGGRPSIALMAVTSDAEVAFPPGEEKEMSDLEKFFDRWNTRGGAVLATFVALVGGLVLEKGLEFVGVESITAGIWTSGVFFFGLLIWTFQYVTRVMTKSTTYAEQLANYEQEVMIKRLRELDDEEIQALCEEVGITQEDISEAVGGKLQALSQKEKVLQLFRNTKMPKDPRTMMNS
mmetsp:Transcript_29620/g.81481  ORF Transcript_29620/g.81481 Transcript_29620/m.81481 type:complete len:233 (-) Transcript_29620:149-847(-)